MFVWQFIAVKNLSGTSIKYANSYKSPTIKFVIQFFKYLTRLCRFFYSHFYIISSRGRTLLTLYHTTAHCPNLCLFIVIDQTSTLLRKIKLICAGLKIQGSLKITTKLYKNLTFDLSIFKFFKIPPEFGLVKESGEGHRAEHLDGRDYLISITLICIWDTPWVAETLNWIPWLALS